jgi:hypothetical protein
MDQKEFFATVSIFFFIMILFSPQGSNFWMTPFIIGIVFALFWWKF